MGWKLCLLIIPKYPLNFKKSVSSAIQHYGDKCSKEGISEHKNLYHDGIVVYIFKMNNDYIELI